MLKQKMIRKIKQNNFRSTGVCRYGNAAIMIFLGIYFFVIPFFIMLYYLADPGIKNGSVAKQAYDLHRSLSPKYEKWAKGRISSGRAESLDIEDIAGTEWPVFGSAFYLLATESLQQDWQKNKDRSSVAPNVYAAGAIEAATALVADPGHGSWVKQHWGDDYLHRENIFYRMLVISSLTSYQKLLGGDKYSDMLRDQVESLSKELDESKYGLLDDYPGQCYPTDVVAAIAAIQRADEVLGTDHSEFIKRSVRGFQGRFVDSTGLPPYEADADSGTIGIARGCSSQWITVWAPDIWPGYAKQLYENFEKHFWQYRFGAYGFREFTKDESKGEWYFDVDSGPVIAGHGAAASAFGLGAARVNGRFDHAYPLTAEEIVFSWPLINGTLAMPRILSNVTHAPYLGEASVIFNLTRMPAEGVEIVTGGRLPVIAYVVLTLFLAIGTAVICSATATLVRWEKHFAEESIAFENIQLKMWVALIIAGFMLCFFYNFGVGLICLLSAQFLPRWRRRRVEQVET